MERIQTAQGLQDPKDDLLVTFLGFLIYTTPKAEEAGNLDTLVSVDKHQTKPTRKTTKAYLL